MPTHSSRRALFGVLAATLLSTSVPARAQERRVPLSPSPVTLEVTELSEPPLDPASGPPIASEFPEPPAPLVVPVPQPPGDTSADAETLARIRAELARGDNAILLAAEKMLTRRITSRRGSVPEPKALWHVGVESGLRRELTGGYLSLGGGGLGDEIDLLTGKRAIDESLQLGTIDPVRDADPDEQLRESVASALERLRREGGRYPERLEDVAPADGDRYDYNRTVFYAGETRSIASLASKFHYSSEGTSYTLTLRDAGRTSFSVAEVTPVEVRSHPWEEMLAGRDPARPASAAIVPRDVLFVHLGTRETYRSLADAVRKVAEPLAVLFDVQDPFVYEERVADRLGVGSVDELLELVDDLTFVSEDVSFFPNTDYALILRLRPGVSPAVALFGQKDDRRGFVGDFYVIASSPQLFLRITETAGDPSSSLDAALDFRYALAELENRRDAEVYLSEDFIRKLVSPGYRIGAARRNVALRELEALQESVFAYRHLEGRWPSSITALGTEEYLDLGSLAGRASYSLQEDGIVQHTDWGTIWDPTPLSRVPVTEVTPVEKHRYESFVLGYQSYWREFFDPIGVAVTDGDHVKLHTIILPLIDESQYNAVRDVTGGAPGALSFVTDPDRPTASTLAARLSVDGVFAAIAREERTEVAELRAKAEASFREFADWNEPGSIFDCVGDEVMLGIGSGMPHEISNVGDIDAWIGVRLTDPEKAKRVIAAAYSAVAREMRSNQREFGGFFQISRKEPLKNTYNGRDYYLIPTGFVNVYYTFLDDRLYLTVSQDALNQLIDGSATTQELTAPTQRVLDYIGRSHSVVLVQDYSALDAWWSGLRDREMSSYQARALLSQDAALLREARTLAATFPDDDGTLAPVRRYYPHLPERWLGAELRVAGGVISVVTPTRTVALDDVDVTSRSYYSWEDDDEAPERPPVSVNELASEFNFFDIVAPAWEAQRDAGVSLSFTPEGISVQLAFNHAGRTDIDPRFPLGDTRSTEEIRSAGLQTAPTRPWTESFARWWAQPWVRTSAVVLLVLIVLVVGAWIVRRKPTDRPSPPSPPAAPPPPPAG